MLRKLLLFTAVVCLTLVATTPTSGASDGRWKDDGNGGCYFDANDSGPDQCSPTPGRWKDDGNGGCYFDANDSGPNQCQPQQPPAIAEDPGAPDAAAADRYTSRR
jgi:hypothetical protein